MSTSTLTLTHNFDLLTSSALVQFINNKKTHPNKILNILDKICVFSSLHFIEGYLCKNCWLFTYSEDQPLVSQLTVDIHVPITISIHCSHVFIHQWFIQCFMPLNCCYQIQFQCISNVEPFFMPIKGRYTSQYTVFVFVCL